MSPCGRRAALAALALALAVPVRAAAQEDDPWLFRLLAYPAFNFLDGLSANAGVSWRKDPRPGPFPITAQVDALGRLTTSGTRGIGVTFDAPGLWRDWRVLAVADIERFQRAPYFGLGNEPELNDSLEAANGKTPYYRFSLLRATAFVAAQRTISGPLRIMGGTRVRRYRALPLESGDTKLGRDLAAAVVRDTGASLGVELRGGLLFDTRDEEFSPSRGVFVEALAARGMGDYRYTRYALGARTFIPVGEYTVLALRQAIQFSDGPLPFFVAYENLTDWRLDDGIGGQTTLRAHLPGRFIAENRAVVSADLRFKKIDVPLRTTPVRWWWLAFADVGRLWRHGENPTLDGLQVGSGIGTRLQFGKGFMLGFDLGASRDSGFDFTTAFSFGF